MIIVTTDLFNREHDADDFNTEGGLLFLYKGGAKVAVYRDWDSVRLEEG